MLQTHRSTSWHIFTRGNYINDRSLRLDIIKALSHECRISLREERMPFSASVDIRFMSVWYFEWTLIIVRCHFPLLSTSFVFHALNVIRFSCVTYAAILWQGLNERVMWLLSIIRIPWCYKYRMEAIKKDQGCGGCTGWLKRQQLNTLS